HGGVQGVASYSFQHARDMDTGLSLVNSPGQLGKFRVSVPGPWSGSFFSGEVLTIGSRRTLAGDWLKPVATANATFTAPLRGPFELTGSVRNLFNVQYTEPASDQHVQD